jgi:hypothetical protein
MSAHTLTYTLKQHTPMIHFQSDQSGATLRATELKPKLDKFLISNYADLKTRKHHNSESLEYKIRIIYGGNSSKDYPKTYVNTKKGDKGYTAPYFAEGLSLDQLGDVLISFSSFDTEIIDAIQKYISLFFTYQNFGTRQSKGFGSYHLKEMTQKELESLLLKHPFPVYKLNLSASNPKEAMGKIDSFYKELKTGTNRPYLKSILFQYMCNKNIGWEKRWLKEKYPEIIHGENSPMDCSPRKEYFYIRAMLGLAETNEFRPSDGKKTIKIKSVEKEGDKPKIQRFKSPITFKVFSNHIYLLHNDTYRDLLDKEFEFSLGGKTNKIKTPKDFDLNDFLKYVEKEHKKITLLGGAK